MQARYTIEYNQRVRTSWIQWHDTHKTEHAKTKEERDLLIEIIKSDQTITYAFYTDLSNKKVTNFK
jgi:hypothetical protein